MKNSSIVYRTGYKISSSPSSLKSQNNIQVQKPDQNSNHNRLERTKSLVVRGLHYQKLKILVSIPALLIVLITRFLLWLIRTHAGCRWAFLSNGSNRRDHPTQNYQLDDLLICLSNK